MNSNSSFSSHPIFKAKNLLTLFFTICFLALFFPFYKPILSAIIFAFGLNPMLDQFSSKFKIHRSRAFILWMLVFGLTMATLLASSVFRIYSLTLGEDQEEIVQVGVQYWDSISPRLDAIFDWIKPYLSYFGLKSSAIQEHLGKLTQTSLKTSLALVVKTLSNFPSLLLNGTIFLLFLTLAIVKKTAIKKWFSQRRVFNWEELNDLLSIFQNASRTMISSNFIVGFVQAIVTAIGASMLGISEGSIIFFFTFLFSFIPVIGAAPVSFLIALHFFLMGSIGHSIAMLVLGILVGVVDNFLKPMLMNQSEDSLHPLITFIGLLGSITIFGITGLFWGPFIMGVTGSLLGRTATSPKASEE